MGIYQNLETLESNLYNAKKSLANTLVGKGVDSDAENETLTQLIGKIDDIQTGGEIKNQTKKITIVSNGEIVVKPDDVYSGLELVGIKVDVKTYSDVLSPEDLWESLCGNNIYYWDDYDKCLYYPNGNFILNNSWLVQYYKDGSWYEQHNNNYNTWNTVFPEDWVEFNSLKNKYKILHNRWSNHLGQNVYNTPEELFIAQAQEHEQYFYNLYEGSCYDFYDNEIKYKYSDVDFNFYYKNSDGNYEMYYKELPNGGSATFYPLFEKKMYCKEYDSNAFEGDIVEFLGVNIKPRRINEFGEADINVGKKLIKSQFINFIDDCNLCTRLFWDYNGYSDERFQYLTSVRRIERFTYPSYQTNIHLGTEIINNSELDYIGEFVFEENVTFFNLIHLDNKIEYCLLKNIGICENMSYFSCVSDYWGIDNKYPNSHQAAIDSLITHSFDRASAGYKALTIKLGGSLINSLFNEEIAAITAKGFTIAY